MTTTRHRLAPLLFASTLAVAACGSDGDEQAAEPTDAAASTAVPVDGEDQDVDEPAAEPADEAADDDHATEDHEDDEHEEHADDDDHHEDHDDGHTDEEDHEDEDEEDHDDHDDDDEDHDGDDDHDDDHDDHDHDEDHADDDHDDHDHDGSSGLGAHEHGAAELSVAWVGAEVAVDLISPTFNVFGFEYEPTTDEDIALEADRTDALTADGVIAINDDAGCALSDHVDTETEREGSHSEITVSWRFVCDNPDEVEALDLSQLFAEFPGFDDIDAQWLSESEQSSAELTPSSPTLTLRP